PEWYTFLWLPALVWAILPVPRRWALVGMAVVAGTAAALIAWGAAVEGRLALATRDAQRLGHEGDAVAVALLERLGQQVTTPSQPPPRTAGDLYALWVGSPLVAEDYPAMLELWGAGPEGPPLAELQLASLDLPPRLLSTLARSAGAAPCIERLERIPGIHYVLVALLAGVWLFGLIGAAGWRARVPALVTGLRKSYRAQLTSVLITFFVLPVLGFAAWSFTDLAEDARRSGDLLIRQTLRDAAAGAETVAQDPPEA